MTIRAGSLYCADLLSRRWVGGAQVATPQRKGETMMATMDGLDLSSLRDDGDTLELEDGRT